MECVDYSLSTEQEELRRIVRRALEPRAGAARRFLDSDADFDRALWTVLSGELGVTAFGIPEEFGGIDGSLVELGIVMEELGAALAPVPYFSSVVQAGQTLVHSDDASAMEEFLPAIAEGSLLATVAYVEESGQWTPAASAIATEAEVVDGQWRLRGRKTHVVHASSADMVIVLALTGGGPTLFLVDEWSKVSREALEVLDPTRPLCALSFDGAPARILGEEGQGLRILGSALSIAEVALAAEQVGGAQACLDMSVEYAKVREQFGRIIGSFQAVQHKCAEMRVWVDGARSIAYWPLLAGSSGADLAVEAAAAQVHCSSAFAHCATENIQVHGGTGYTWEHNAHLYFRRARSDRALMGDEAHHRERVAALSGY